MERFLNDKCRINYSLLTSVQTFKQRWLLMLLRKLFQCKQVSVVHSALGATRPFKGREEKSSFKTQCFIKISVRINARHLSFLFPP